MTMYRCTFVGDCAQATRGELIELEPGASLDCPGCNKPLELVPAQEKRGGSSRKTTAIAAGIFGVLVVSGAAFALWGKKQGAPVSAATAVPAAAGVTPASPGPIVRTSLAPAAIAPSELALAAEKREGQTGLGSGDNARAADASARAASNEMVKLGIAKLAQGKIDEAEKSFNRALEIDPRQSLAYYNMAVLRLRQDRTDEALKQFEASFMNGFSYFDKLDEDRDLDGVRQDKRFADLLARYRPAAKQ